MKRMFLLLSCLTVFGFCLHARPQHEVTGPLRVGIGPVFDAIPLMLAQDRGYFQQEGVEVELVLFPNPHERDMALQAGHLDGAVNDLLTVSFLTAAGFDFRGTNIAKARFGIVASPQSGITTLEGLRGRNIGLFPNTITQFIADSLLDMVGVPMTDYDSIAVPNILIRLEMVLNGQIDAAVLPEPILTAATAQGATLLGTTDGTGLNLAMLFFSQRVLDTRMEEIRAFFRAYYRAATAINADPDAFRDFLVERAGFPVAIRDVFDFLTFTPPAVQEEHHIRRALDWLRARGLLTADISPSDLIDTRPISEWLN